MNVFQRLGSALDGLWAAIDPDEPVFCDCTSARFCTDCTLTGPVEPAADWARAPASPIPAA